MAKSRSSLLKLTPADYAAIDAAVKPTGNEVYSVVAHKHRGQYKRSIHVFTRNPNESEIQTYEKTASRVEFRGQRAKVKGSVVSAAVALYNALIDRAYDVPVGIRVEEMLTGTDVRDKVDVLTKRTAVTELIGQVWGSSAFDEDEDADEDEGDE